MEEKYCVTLPEEKRRHPHDTMGALLDSDSNFAQLRLFDSIDDALLAAKLYKVEKGDPYTVCQIRPYLGSNSIMEDIIQRGGRWNFGLVVGWA